MTIARAVTLWIVYVVIFNLAGGLAAGVLALIVEALGGGFSQMLYAAVYAVTGFIGYRLAKKVVETPPAPSGHPPQGGSESTGLG